MSVERLNAIEGRLHAIEKKIAVDDKVGETIEKRLDKIEDTLTWLVRLIIGAILTAFVMFAIAGGLGIGQ